MACNEILFGKKTVLLNNIKEWTEQYGFFFIGLAILISIGFGLTVYLFSPVSSLFIVVAMTIGIASLLRPQVLVAVLIFIIPLQAQVPEEFNLPMGINVFNLLFLLLYLVWFFRVLFLEKCLFHLDTMGGVILLFVGITFASMFWSARLMGQWFFYENIEEAKRWISIMLVYFPIAHLDFDEKQIKRFIWYIIVINLIVSVWTIIDCYNADFDFSEDNRIHGPFAKGGENDLSAFFVFYSPIALALGLFDKVFWRRLLLLGIFTISALAIFFTYSRGAYLGIAAVIGFAALIYSRKLLLAIVLLIITMNFWMPATVKNRAAMTNSSLVVERRVDEGERALEPGDFASRLEGSSAQRIIIWRGALKMIKENPVFGLGFMTFYYQITNYAQLRPKERWDTHHQYLKVAAEMGLIGLGVFLMLWAVPFVRSLKLYIRNKDDFVRAVALAGMASVLGIAVVNLFGSRFFREELIGLYFVFSALLYRLQIMRIGINEK